MKDPHVEYAENLLAAVSAAGDALLVLRVVVGDGVVLACDPC